MGVSGHSDSRRGRWILLCAVVVAVALSAATGVVTADSHGSVERTGDTVTVTVPQSSFDGNQSAVVVVNGEVAARYTPTFSGGSNTTEVDIQQLRNRRGSLAAANVSVTNASDTLASATINLQYIESGGNATLSVRDSGSYVALPVNRSTAVGLEPDEEVDVEVDNGSGNVTVTGRYTDGDILVSTATLRDEVGVFNSLVFRPLPNVSDVRYEVTPDSEATAGIYPAQGATVITHPLVFSGTGYDVEVTTTDPEGSYSQRVTPTTDGRLRLPESIFYAESVSVSISDPNGELDYSTDSVSISSDIGTTDGTWDRANGTLAVDDFPENISALWIRDNNTVRTVDTNRVNATAGTVNLTGTGIAPGDNATALLVGTETLEVTISVQGASDSSPNTQENQSMLDSILDGLMNNISIIVTLLVTPVVGLLTMKATQRVDRIDTHALTVGVVAVVLGLGVGVWYTPTTTALVSFLLLALVVAGIQLFLWLELSRKRDIDALVSVGAGMVAAGLVVGLLGAIKFFVLGDSEAAVYLNVVGAGYGLLAAGVLSGSLSVGQSSGGGTTGPPTYDTTVRIEDETGSLISGPTQVTLTRGQGLDGSQTETVTGGSATVSLEPGDWSAKAKVDGQTVRTRTKINRAGKRLTLQFSGRTVDLDIVDKETRSSIPDATLTVTVDGKQSRHSPNRDGSWRKTYPRSAEDISLTVSHDRYEDVSISRSLADDIDGRVQMTPLKGTLVAKVTVGGGGVPGIPVELTPTDTALSDGFSGTTDGNGEVTFDEVRIGSYEAVPSLAEKPTEFSADGVSVRISEDRRTRETLPVQFDYALSSDHRRTVRDLRDRASDIATVSRRDGAIQSFYASVVHELLDAVEDIPNQANPLLVAGVAPDRVVEAMLSAVEKAADTVDDVMSSKRNVDLFAACTDLPSASVTWDGSVSIAEMLELSEQAIGQQRGDLADQVDRVDDRISTERRDLAEISPAREMLEGVRAMVRDSADASQIDSAALVVVADALLDAIESLFDRTQLRKRMERTVY